jgi:hypothetical protein
MANSKPSRNAKALRNAPVYRAFSPKITHSIPRRPKFYFYSGTYSGEVLDALSAIISSINHHLR